MRVLLRRETDVDVISMHDYLYEVERINRNIEGIVELDLTHFPVNAYDQSILALIVNDATAPGYTLPTGRGAFTCDIPGRAGNTTPIGTDPYVDPGLPDPEDLEYNVPDAPETTPPGETPDPLTEAPPNPANGPSNPTDPLDQPVDPEITGPTGPGGEPLPGDELELEESCPGMYTEWVLVDPDTGEETIVSEGVAATYTWQFADSGKTVYARGRCPDSGSPTGFGSDFTSLLLTSSAWNGTGVPQTIEVENTTTVVSSLWFNCDPFYVIEPAGTQTVSDTDVYYGITGWRIVGPTSVQTDTVCGPNPPGPGTDNYSVTRLELLSSAGVTSQTIGAAGWNNTGSNSVSRSYTFLVVVTPL